MGMNSMVGVCQQQKNNSGPAPAITITDVTFQTKSYGTTLVADPPPTSIPGSDQITTVLNAGNSFTVPADGLAQYYSGSNTSQQVFHNMTVNYSANFTESSLPANGACSFVFETTMNEAPAASQLSTWPLEGNVQGAFLPNSSRTNGVRITTTPSLQKNGVFPTGPIVGYTDAVLANGVQVLVGGSVTDNNATDNLTKITFGATPSP